MGRGRLLRGLLGMALVVAFAAPWVAGAGVASAASAPAGDVYTSSNAASGNAVLVFDRAADGTLSAPRSFATGGLGTGAGLGSQGALALSADRRFLYAVNAGSADVSAFAVRPDGLALLGRTPSGGTQPVSLSVHGNLLYALNAGGSGDISGFVIGPDGMPAPLAGSTRWLSNGGAGAAPGPAQVQFSPDGTVLVVTEKATNLIDTYAVGPDGRAVGPAVHPSAGVTPFGFDFTGRHTLIVSDAFGGAAGQGALSSYAVSATGFRAVTPLAPTNQTAACWVIVTGDGRFAYTTNAGSGSISGFAVDRAGHLQLLDPDGRTGVTGDGSHPIDMALSLGSLYLYALDSGTQALSAFAVQADGHLAAVPGIAGLPAGAAGLAAR